MPFKSRHQLHVCDRPCRGARVGRAHSRHQALPEKTKSKRSQGKTTHKAARLVPGERLLILDDDTPAISHALSTALKTAASQGPPNLRQSADATQSCGACKHFQSGVCTKYGAEQGGTPVQDDQVCDGFELKVSPASFSIPASAPMSPLFASGSTLDDVAGAPGTGTGLAGNSFKLGSAIGQSAYRAAKAQGAFQPPVVPPCDRSNWTPRSTKTPPESG